MVEIIFDKKNKDNSVLVFDLETDVLKPLNLGYLREAVARLDSIFDKVLEAKLMERYKSKDARKLISLMSEARISSALPLLAYKSDIITKSQKERIEKFKSFRNDILHNSFGEFKVLSKSKQDAHSKNELDIFIKKEVEEYIQLLRGIVNR